MRSTTVLTPGMYVTDRIFEVPVNYDRPDDGKIEIFARELVSFDTAKRSGVPYLIFFQGGPGSASPRPVGYSGWIKRAMRDFKVLLLDQRGTGRSSPITYQTLENFESDEDKAEYLKNFRADSIVKDAEFIRERLAGENTKWYALGQSYGGFCLTHYVSAFPDSLSGVVVTGGIPPVGVDVDDVYRATYKRCRKKNERYYQRYQSDIKLVNQIMDHLSDTPALLPGGGKLTVERFQQLGIGFGMSEGFEHLHYLIEDPFVKVGGKQELAFTFLKKLEQAQSFETNPLYVLLHESIYMEGKASKWSAHRVRDEFPEFDANSKNEVKYFTGEMVYPWMFDQYDYLYPMKESGNLLAEFGDWPALYDIEKLKKNDVRFVALVYDDDMYVEREFSIKAADIIGNTKLWITNEYEHNGLRADGFRVLDRLLSMLKGDIEFSS